MARDPKPAQKGGLAVFVKTPGLSEVKTRLAESIGRLRALEFYTLACAAVRSVVAGTAPQIASYWAVAEADGAERWRDLPVLLQGQGGLGPRLHRIYDELLRRHGMAYLIGADCPQITSDQIEEAWERLDDGADFVVGPARDGGFYLFAGRKAIPADIWESVEYSAATTLASLVAKLAPLGEIVWLEMRTDADHGADLKEVRREIAAVSPATEEQRELGRWIERVET